MFDKPVSAQFKACKSAGSVTRQGRQINLIIGLKIVYIYNISQNAQFIKVIKYGLRGILVFVL